VWLSIKKSRRTVHRQQLFCRILFVSHLAKALLSVICYSINKNRRHGTKWRWRRLCRVSSLTLDKSPLFAECMWYWHSAKKFPVDLFDGLLLSALGRTRQRLLLCRVPRTQHSAKKLYRFPGVSSLPSAIVMTLCKVPLCRVLHSTKWPKYCFLFVSIIQSKQTKDISYNHHI
jgi:hypothetical protein